MLNARLILSSVLLSSFLACAPGTDEPLPSEEVGTIEDTRALEGDTVYVVTRQDFRKCAYPMCGGVYVKAVNKAKTTCLDGSKQADCYVGELDLSGLELSEDQTVDVRSRATAGDVILSGEIAPLENFPEFGRVVAHKAYQARTEADATGTYYSVGDSGIVCITTPCPSLQGAKLNTTTVKQLTDVDFSALGLTEDEIAATMSTAMQKNLIMTGVIKTSGQKKKLKVSQIFDTVEPQQALCLGSDECGEGAYCDMTECLSGCAPGMVCPAVCYGACKPGEEPAPSGGSCVDACGGAAADESCYCDSACEYYGDCCGDYVSECL